MGSHVLELYYIPWHYPRISSRQYPHSQLLHFPLAPYFPITHLCLPPPPYSHQPIKTDFLSNQNNSSTIHHQLWLLSHRHNSSMDGACHLCKYYLDNIATQQLSPDNTVLLHCRRLQLCHLPNRHRLRTYPHISDLQCWDRCTMALDLKSAHLHSPPELYCSRDNDDKEAKPFHLLRPLDKREYPNNTKVSDT